MRNFKATYLSLATFLGALLVWAAVFYLAWTISLEEEARALETANLEETSIRQAVAIRTHALARETKREREALEGITRTEVVEILDEIEALARVTKIPIAIKQALSAPEQSSSLQTMSFVIEATGTFSEVAYVAALFESFPILSSVHELQFEQIPNSPERAGKSSLWRLIVRIQFFTTAEIST